MYVRIPSSPMNITGVPSSQALPGYLITAPPSVCVPDVIGALTVWIQNQKKNTLEGLPSKRYHVHQQRAPDLCSPTFQLVTGYTPILDSEFTDQRTKIIET